MIHDNEKRRTSASNVRQRQEVKIFVTKSVRQRFTALKKNLQKYRLYTAHSGLTELCCLLAFAEVYKQPC